MVGRFEVPMAAFIARGAAPSDEARLHLIVASVRSVAEGEPPHRVATQIRSRLLEAGLEPVDEAIWPVAQWISRGELTQAEIDAARPIPMPVS